MKGEGEVGPTLFGRDVFQLEAQLTLPKKKRIETRRNPNCELKFLERGGLFKKNVEFFSFPCTTLLACSGSFACHHPTISPSPLQQPCKHVRYRSSRQRCTCRHGQQCCSGPTFDQQGKATVGSGAETTGQRGSCCTKSWQGCRLHHCCRCRIEAKARS